MSESSCGERGGFVERIANAWGLVAWRAGISGVVCIMSLGMAAL
jgi:hypothetical protein